MNLKTEMNAEVAEKIEWKEEKISDL